MKGAPVTATTTLPPRSARRFADFAQALVRRYGPRGTFWRAHPSLPEHPIRAWQIWNEPNLPVYWGGTPDARAYVALLRAADAAIRSADPGAEVVTAGIPDSRLGVPLAKFIRRLYAAGARGSFETLAVQPYATSARGVLAGARAARRIADAAGDEGAHLWITEAGWASGGPGSDFTVSPARQAQLVTRLLREAARQASALRLRGVVYYSWRDAPVYPGGHDFWGLHTGMVTRANKVKPALDAFARSAGALNARTR